ncbi:MAG: hypothetical protein LBN29_08525 [Mediterranea sp.]|jgi:hypothetical protein|nr:hypothetical protein [Mediterranea sp.]
MKAGTIKLVMTLINMVELIAIITYVSEHLHASAMIVVFFLMPLYIASLAILAVATKLNHRIMINLYFASSILVLSFIVYCTFNLH